MLVSTSYPKYVTARHPDIGDVSISDLIVAAKRYGEFYWDLETSGLNPRTDTIDGIALYIPKTKRTPEYRVWYPFVDDTALLTVYICPKCPWQSFYEEDVVKVDVGSMDRFMCPDCHTPINMETVSLRPPMDPDDTFEALRPLFENESLICWAYHEKFDCEFVEKHTPISEIKARRADPMLLVFGADENPKQFGLKPTTWRWFKHKMVTFKEAKVSRQGRFAFDFKTPLCEYAMDDCYWAWRCKEKALEMIQEQDPSGRIERLFWGLDMPVSRIIQEMESTGVKIDWEHLSKLDARLEEEQTNVYKNQIEALTADWDNPINLGSQKDKSDFLFGHVDDGGLGLPTTGLVMNEKGCYPTGKDEIKHLKYASSVVEEVLKWNSLATIRSGFTGKIRDLACQSPDGRIYFHFNQTGTVIGRMSSSNPVNGQNIPRAGEMYGMPGVRYAFCSAYPWDLKDDMLLYGADFSQIELRVAAHLAIEPTMIEVYKFKDCRNEPGGMPCERYAQGHECKGDGCPWSGNVMPGSKCPKCGSELEWQARCKHMDLHQRTADDVGVPRSLAKNLNFGNLYRQGPSRFCETAGLFDEHGVKRIPYAKEVQDGWMNVYSGIPRYHNHVEDELKDNGWVSYTITGRQRRLAELAKDYGKRYRAITQGIQFAISGSAQDIMKNAMIRVWRAIRKKIAESPKAIADQWRRVKFLLQVHDEIILQGPACLKEEIKQLMEEQMEGAVNTKVFRVPLVVQAKSGRNWNEIH